MTVEWTAENAAHLLRRSGFGPTSAEVKQLVKKGQAGAIQSLFKKGTPSDKWKYDPDETYLNEMQNWWVKRMLAAKVPLVEKMALFWHNFFATAISKLESVHLMHQQNRTLRKYALKSFRELLNAMCRDPALLIWLDNDSNVAEDPNENFARELQELFSTGTHDAAGAPNYSEQDVVECARAFTGWTVRNDDFYFDAGEHDFGTKTFKGTTGPLDGTDVIELLVVDPATARRIAHKLYSFFARDVELSDPVLDPLVQAYYDHDTAIRPVLEAIFGSDGFYADDVRYARVKSPVEFLVGSIRMLKGKVVDKNDAHYWIGEYLQSLGQSIFDPPSVFGWNEGMSWASSNALLQRSQMAERIADARGFDSPPIVWKPKSFLPKPSKWGGYDAAGVVEFVLSALGPVRAEPSTVALLEQYLLADENGLPGSFSLAEDSIDSKVRGLVALVLSSPEFQLA